MRQAMARIVCTLPQTLYAAEAIDSYPQRLEDVQQDGQYLKLTIETCSTDTRAALKVMTQKYSYAPEVAKFLAPSSRVECGHQEIVALAQSLAQDYQDMIGLAKSFAEWIATNTSHDNEQAERISAGGRPLGALEFLHSRQGTCGERAHLLAAFLRAKGIPSKFVHGCLLPWKPDEHTWAHAWVEVYLAGEGWLPLDPRKSNEPQRKDYLTAENYVKLFEGADFSAIGILMPDLRDAKIEWG
jgi:transglutaminase-like putative cysteine protease